MSGRTKPKRMRRPALKAANPLAHLFTHASRLRPGEIESLMVPKRAALHAARTAMLTESGFNDLCTALNVGEAIQRLGVVRVDPAHLAKARDVLETIGHSMDSPTGWRPHALRWDAIEALDVLLAIHHRQLQELQYNEYQAACRLAEARVASEGGVVIRNQELPHA